LQPKTLNSRQLEAIMLESKQHTQLRYFLDFDIPNPINDRVKRCLVDLINLFRPEDTTDSLDDHQKEMIFPKDSKTGSTVKAVVWVALSIALSLVIGQLGN